MRRNSWEAPHAPQLQTPRRGSRKSHCALRVRSAAGVSGAQGGQEMDGNGSGAGAPEGGDVPGVLHGDVASSGTVVRCDDLIGVLFPQFRAVLVERVFTECGVVHIVARPSMARLRARTASFRRVMCTAATNAGWPTRTASWPSPACTGSPGHPSGSPMPRAPGTPARTASGSGSSGMRNWWTTFGARWRRWSTCGTRSSPPVPRHHRRTVAPTARPPLEMMPQAPLGHRRWTRSTTIARPFAPSNRLQEQRVSCPLHWPQRPTH